MIPAIPTLVASRVWRPDALCAWAARRGRPRLFGPIMTTLDAASPPEPRADVLPYMALAMMAGTTAGMLRALSPVFAIHLGASNAQIGVIAGLESLGMAA